VSGYANLASRNLILKKNVMRLPGLALLTIVSLFVFISQPANAGRPLTVDDANVNDLGAGHVEAWYARMPGDVNTWNVAPAYSPIKDVELAALLSRNTTEELMSSAVQLKWRITPSQTEGCNFGLVAGVSHTNQGEGNTPYLNGLGTCNHKIGTFHVNLGVADPEGEKALGTWGLAYEREIVGLTAHVEVFGEEHRKPTTQFGMRKDVVQGLQLDGTIGRSDNDTVFSIGLKKSF
jgi:hypothetical protein